MERLKKIFTKRNIFTTVALLFTIAVFLSFRDNLAGNLFGVKAFTKLAFPQQSLLTAVFIIFSTLIVYNLITYLYPDNLVSWFIQRFFPNKNANADESHAAVLVTARQVWLALCAAFLSVFTLVLSEWIFWVTKESFMDSLPALQKGSILLQSAWILSIPVLLIALILWLVSALLKNPIVNRIILTGLKLLSAFCLAVTVLLVFDNFTYIILGKGIVDSYSLFRASYGLAFLLFINKAVVKLNFNPASSSAKGMWKIATIAAISLFSLGALATLFGVLNSKAVTDPRGATLPTRTPNIILIGSDGVAADNLSIYGYKRQTTPFLDSIADQALIAEDNFAQTGSSWGSLISIFTSKLPTQTRVVNLPDALVGNDSYEHLPGVLRDYGYTSIDITYERYANASLANVRNGFDRINGKTIASNPLITWLGKLLPVNSQYNLDLMLERIGDRLGHIFFIKIMPNPYRDVLTLTGRKDATSRIPELMDFVNHGTEPFFMHVHLLGTHGPSYKTTSKLFSGGRTQEKAFDEDFYDDAIVDFDSYMRDLFTTLQANGKLAHTLVIVYSDHPRKRSAYQHTPLIFWFPDGAFAGRIESNTQNLDIAPTILDYLGVQVPTWMEGQSLLQGAPAADRPIYSVLWKDRKKNLGMDPAFHQFGFFRMVVCNRYVQFSSTKLAWESGDVVDHTQACSADQELTDTQMIEQLLQRLKQDGFDTALMEAALPIKP